MPAKIQTMNLLSEAKPRVVWPDSQAEAEDDAGKGAPQAGSPGSGYVDKSY
jgi:hypothetical protein